jgi:hypothetical protein
LSETAARAAIAAQQQKELTWQHARYLNQEPN